MFELGLAEGVTPTRVVVVGSRGVIGRSLMKLLESENVPALGLSSQDLDLLSADAGDRLCRFLRPEDALVVLAALTPDKGRDAATLQKNIAMAEAVCTALRRTPCSHVVYMSSDAVYPLTGGLVSEESPAAPADLYGAMHRVREIMFAEACRQMPLAVLRCTMVLAADDTHNSYGPNRFRRQALSEGRIVLGGEGEETRDHVAVEDVARLLLEVLRHRGAGILNLASGRSHTFRQVAEIVAAHLARSPELVFTPRHAPVTHRHFDPTLLRRAFPDFRFAVLDDAIADIHRKMGLASRS